MRRLAALSWLWLGLAAVVAVAAAPASAQEPAQERVQQPANAGGGVVRTIEVPLRDGKVGLDQLARALLDGHGLDGSALRWPERAIDVRGVRGGLALLALRKLLLDTVHFRRSRGGETLVVTFDREREREVRRRLRARLAHWFGDLTGADLSVRTYALAVPPALDRDRPLAVLVHGVDSGPAVWSDLLEFLDRQPGRFQLATFAYANDESVERVAAALAAELRALGEQRVAIVGYSMGGLVGRIAVEDPDLDPGNVELLVQIGTPNRGSNLACLRFGLDAAHLLQRPDGADSFGRGLYAAMQDNLVDGLGEAGGDLWPRSVFLAKVAAHGRNPRVAYRAVLGTRAPLSEAQLGALRQRAAAWLGAAARTRWLRPGVETWLADLDELVDGRGDGAVSVARGSCAGVEPVLVRLDHVALIRRHGVLSRTAPSAPHPVFACVEQWLAELAGASRAHPR